MARFRLSRPARADLARILATSVERWGIQNRRRYAAILSAAMRKAAVDPEGPVTRARAELLPGIRSMHVRHARNKSSGAEVVSPVHILYYRKIQPGFIEIVRVLHERMEPSRHLDAASFDKD